MRKKLICTVHDKAEARLLLQKVFPITDGVYKLKDFADGFSLFNYLLASPRRPDLIFIDLDLPNLDGLQILKLLKENLEWKSIPTTVWSDEATVEEIHACYQSGADSVIIEPVAPPDLRIELL